MLASTLSPMLGKYVNNMPPTGIMGGAPVSSGPPVAGGIPTMGMPQMGISAGGFAGFAPQNRGVQVRTSGPQGMPPGLQGRRLPPGLQRKPLPPGLQGRAGNPYQIMNGGFGGGIRPMQPPMGPSNAMLQMLRGRAQNNQALQLGTNPPMQAQFGGPAGQYSGLLSGAMSFAPTSYFRR